MMAWLDAPASCLPAHTHVSTAGIALGIFLIVGTVAGALPQLWKLHQEQSSAGMSVLTPALVLMYGTLNLCATITVKWPTVLSCGTLSKGGCLLQLLDALQQGASAITLVAILLLTVAYPPNDLVRPRAIAVAALVGLSALGVLTCVVSGRAPCSTLSLDFATSLTTAAGVVVTLAFAPQLVESWRTRGRGSLSYMYYLIQVVGCMLVIGEQLVALHDPWQVWLPTAFALLMQLGILLLGLYFRCLSPPVTAPTQDMASALLE